MSTQLWRAPSGRLHLNKSCSGNGRPRDTRRTSLTNAKLRAALEADLVCRCARSRVNAALTSS